MKNIIYYIVPAITGSLIASLGPINGSLQNKAGMWGMAFIVHIIGISFAGSVYLLTKNHCSDLILETSQFMSRTLLAITILTSIFSIGIIYYGISKGLSIISFTGGLFAVLIVIGTVYSVEHLGAFITVAIILMFEILMGAIIDQTGFLSQVKRSITPQRIFSIILIFSGIILSIKSK